MKVLMIGGGGREHALEDEVRPVGVTTVGVALGLCSSFPTGAEPHAREAEDATADDVEVSGVH